MNGILRKLTSRKLWVALAGLVTGAALAFGADQRTVTTLAGAVTALASVVAYVAAEGRADAAGAALAAQAAAAAAEAMREEEHGTA